MLTSEYIQANAKRTYEEHIAQLTKENRRLKSALQWLFHVSTLDESNIDMETYSLISPLIYMKVADNNYTIKEYEEDLQSIRQKGE